MGKQYDFQLTTANPGPLSDAAYDGLADLLIHLHEVRLAEEAAAAASQVPKIKAKSSAKAKGAKRRK